MREIRAEPTPSAPMRGRPPDYAGLVEDHHAAVFRSARRLVLDEDVAKDVTQQVFLDLLRGLVRPEESRDISRVLRWRAIKLALTQLRGDRIRRHREAERAMTSPKTPLHPCDHADDHRVLWSQVDRLPEKLRTAIVLRFQEGFTFAAVAEVLRISEPSAHKRVQKGLERLRSALQGRGPAGLAPALPGALIGPSPLDPVPLELQGALLNLGTASHAAGLGTATVLANPASNGLLLGAAFFVCAAIGTFALWPPEVGVSPMPSERLVGVPNDSPMESLAADAAPILTQPFRALGAPAPSISISTKVRVSRGRLRGRVVDERGGPLAGVLVRAKSRELQGKGARFGAQGRTNDQGRFDLEVSVEAAEGQDYQVWVRVPHYVTWRGPYVRVLREKTHDLGDVKLQASSTDLPGSFVLNVSLVDEEGRSVSGIIVRLLREEETPGGGPTRVWEGAARSLNGRVRFEGHHLGRKTLEVEGGQGEFQRHEEVLFLSFDGDHDHALCLRRGLAISGFVTTTEGPAPKDTVLVAIPPAGSWLFSRPGTDGTFVFTGLSKGLHKISAQDGHGGQTQWSDLGLSVEAGRQGLDVVLKPLFDSRDWGTHAAELHGRVVDDATGEVLPVGALDVAVHAVTDTSRAELLPDDLPDLLPPFMGQLAASGQAPPPGEIHRDGLVPGAYVVRVGFRGRAVAVAGPFVVRAQEVRSDVVVRLRAGVTVSGVVVDAQGRPVIGAAVYPTGSGPRARGRLGARDKEMLAVRGRGRLPFGGHALTDDSGRFTLSHVPDDLGLRLAVVHPKHAPLLDPVPIGLETPVTRTLRLAAR